MKIEEFQLERNQSLYENTVRYNLTESGIHPRALRDFLTEEEQAEVLELELGYGQTNGDPGLRDVIAAQYPGFDRENVSGHQWLRGKRISSRYGACWKRVMKWP